MKIEEQKKAIELRKEGYSFRAIGNTLNVAKSSIRLWTGGISLTPEQKRNLARRDSSHLPKRVFGLKSKKRIEMGEDVWLLYQRERKYKKGKLNAKLVAEYKRRKKRMLIEYKGGKCEVCNYNKNCLRAYHFHHKDPLQKEYGISERSLSFEKCKTEVDKCRLVCSNCHAEIEEKMYNDHMAERIGT